MITPNVKKLISGSEVKIYFSDSRLKITPLGRMFIRFSTNSFYLIFSAATMTFLLQFKEISWLFWISVFSSLFLIDRLLHIGEASRSILNFSGQEANSADYLSPKSFVLIEAAFDRTSIAGGDFSLHLMRRLLKQKEVAVGLLRLDVKVEEVIQKVDEHLEKNAELKMSYDALAGNVEMITKSALKQAAASGGKFIEPKDLFSALNYVGSPDTIKIFNLFSISSNDLENALIFGEFQNGFQIKSKLPKNLSGFAVRRVGAKRRIMNRAWTARPTPFLDQWSVDYTELAKNESVGFLIGHENEYDRLLDILSSPTKPNALLVGEAGSGKNTIVSHLAFQIVNDHVPESLFDKRLISLELSSFSAGADESELKSRIEKIRDEIISAGNVILYISDLHNLKPELIAPLATANFPFIGTTYPREFKNIITTQSGFANLFEVVNIEEITKDEAVKFMIYSALILESQYNHKIVISFGAVKQTVNLAARYFREKLLPGSAEDLLKEAVSDVVGSGERVLTADDVVKIAERKTNVPIAKASAAEAEKLLNLEEIIHQRLIDQEEAVEAVSKALREYRSGLSRKGGPIASFLFVGPTGVGKTELSKILTEIQFGSENQMIRFDMSEYQDKQSLFRFIGSPDGKISGGLTDAVLEKPFSLILLDEFEKAHPDILNLFLQVLDDGRLTDNLGRTVDFQNTIIIATSNANSEFIKTQIEAGEKIENISGELKKKLTNYFRPELINRFSDIIVFKPLSFENVVSITKFALKDLAKTLEAQGISLNFDNSVIQKVAELGFDPVFGARPLRKVISDQLKSVLAEKILKGEIARGGTLSVSIENGEFNFKS